MADVEFKITESLITLQRSGGWRKELNLVSWNGRDPVYDLRGWNENHTKMTKGITFTKDEFDELITKIKEEI